MFDPCNDSDDVEDEDGGEGMISGPSLPALWLLPRFRFPVVLGAMISVATEAL